MDIKSYPKGKNTDGEVKSVKKLLLILSLFLLVSCQGKNDETSPVKNTNDDGGSPLLQVGNRKTNQKPGSEEVDRKNSKTVSEHLEKLAESVPEVKGATAVAIGKYAIVGIDVDENLERSKVGSIKYTVAETLKDDPHGAKAIVVADPDITARLKEIGEDIRAGKPLTGILNELSDIVGRVMPEIPGDLQDPTPKKEMEEQKDDIPKKDEEKLQKQQEEQSNHHE